ncbi:MAG TPA: CcdB family protein [Azospira sp.]|nr:CcdB family protein [Azospira sp.]HNN08011.1 CcdB family protein [Azospira sp.]HNN45316.1 CcdB family protein [Azospira sp.]
MARYNVYPNPGGAGYLLDVQAEVHGLLNTRIVVPLLPLAIAPTPARTLNPLFELNGETVSMVTQYMAAVPVALLKGKIASVEDRRTEIVAALELLLQGF